MIIKTEHEKWLGFDHFECTVMEALGNIKIIPSYWNPHSIDLGRFF